MTGGLDRVERVRTGGEDWHLRDERELLRRSLDDAASEHAAGDLADEDYALLRARDERRLREVDAALAARVVDAAERAASPAAERAGSPAAERAASPSAERAGSPAAERAASPSAERAGTPGHVAGQGGRRGRTVRWRRRWWMALGGVAAVVAATVILVAELTSPRLPGQDATGSISLNTAQTIERQLAQAKTLVARGKATEALQLYGDVLGEDPRQPVALAEWGWLDWRAASRATEPTVAAEGASALEEAVRVDPQLFAAQYYLGVVLYEEGAPGKAVARFARFLADKPTRAWLRQAAPELRAAYHAAHEPVPPGVPSA